LSFFFREWVLVRLLRGMNSEVGVSWGRSCCGVFFVSVGRRWCSYQTNLAKKKKVHNMPPLFEAGIYLLGTNATTLNTTTFTASSHLTPLATPAPTTPPPIYCTSLPTFSLFPWCITPTPPLLQLPPQSTPPQYPIHPLHPFSVKSRSLTTK